MGSIRAFNPVKLFVGVLVANEDLVSDVESQLSSSYGPLDYQSPVLPFTFTDYYRKETGDRILRVFFSFERLIDGDQLPEIKRQTNAMEERFAVTGRGGKTSREPRPGISRALQGRPRIDEEFLSQNVFGAGNLRRDYDAFPGWCV
jgi:hypothetical protein